MNTNSNTYDIDGDIIRQAGDNHKLTLVETKERIDSYYDKIKNLDNEDFTDEEYNKRRSIYELYIRNLTAYLYNRMWTVSAEERKEFLDKIAQEAPQKTTEEQIKEAMEELKNDIEEPKSVTQEDLLVERDTEAPAMDEYVDFEEVEEPKTEENHD